MSADVLISIGFVLFMALGFIFGNLYGRGMQWRNYQRLRESWEKDIKRWRDFYILSEKHRQEFVREFANEKGWKAPDFNVPCQSEIDFSEDSPILIEKD